MQPCVGNSLPRSHHTGPSGSAQSSSWYCWRTRWSTLWYHHTSLATVGAGHSSRRRRIRSSDVPTLTITQTSRRFGDRCFQSAAARLCNRPSSPLLRQPDMTYSQFTGQKSHLFSWDCDALRLLYSAAGSHLIYLLTYFLTFTDVRQNIVTIVHSFIYSYKTQLTKRNWYTWLQ